MHFLLKPWTGFISGSVWNSRGSKRLWPSSFLQLWFLVWIHVESNPVALDASSLWRCVRYSSSLSASVNDKYGDSGNIVKNFECHYGRQVQPLKNSQTCWVSFFCFVCLFLLWKIFGGDFRQVFHVVWRETTGNKKLLHNLSCFHESKQTVIEPSSLKSN